MGARTKGVPIKNIGPRLSSEPYADRECPVHNAIFVRGSVRYAAAAPLHSCVSATVSLIDRGHPDPKTNKIIPYQMII